VAYKIPTEPPVNQIFDTLRQLWKKKTGERYQDLAAKLTVSLKVVVTPQKLSQWATGSDNRRPPWKAIYWLMNATGYQVVLTMKGAKIQKLPSIKRKRVK